ncbi:hypothetical protein BN2364_4302 [Alloalcanivorax xenomutans]|nr:hypothetical protein BN2364_4302 [Alloalcanivorax xenomutans]
MPQGHRIGCCHHSSPEHSLCIGRGRLLLFRHKPGFGSLSNSGGRRKVQVFTNRSSAR